MSYQQAINSALGSLARLGVIHKGLHEASKIRESTERTEKEATKQTATLAENLQRMEKFAKDYPNGYTATYRPQNVPEEIVQFRKMQEANERAARKQELRRIQKENMAYFAGKFWKEQK